MEWVDYLSWALLAGGSFFCVTGAIGLLRLPDFYTRLHGAGIIDTLGAGLILIGLMTQAGFSLVTVKLLFILFFVLLKKMAERRRDERKRKRKPVSWFKIWRQ